jgi:XTP/dITP diphosphohydrolase
LSTAEDREDEPLRVVLATTNRGKLADFRQLFRDTGIELVSPAEVGAALDVEETGTTFLENALLKARAHFAATGLPALADDSGLIAHALGDEPGVRSARYAGEPSDDHANNRLLIQKLHGVADRRASFICALALVLPGGREITAEGSCDGRIIDQERGTNGFGYDSVFYRDDLGCTFGEATREEKNARSHRGAAVRALIARLRKERIVPG